MHFGVRNVLLECIVEGGRDGVIVEVNVIVVAGLVTVEYIVNVSPLFMRKIFYADPGS